MILIAVNSHIDAKLTGLIMKVLSYDGYLQPDRKKSAEHRYIRRLMAFETGLKPAYRTPIDCFFLTAFINLGQEDGKLTGSREL